MRVWCALHTLQGVLNTLSNSVKYTPNFWCALHTQKVCVQRYCWHTLFGVLYIHTSVFTVYCVPVFSDKQIHKHQFLGILSIAIAAPTSWHACNHCKNRSASACSAHYFFSIRTQNVYLVCQYREVSVTNTLPFFFCNGDDISV